MLPQPPLKMSTRFPALILTQIITALTTVGIQVASTRRIIQRLLKGWAIPRRAMTHQGGMALLPEASHLVYPRSYTGMDQASTIL